MSDQIFLGPMGNIEPVLWFSNTSHPKQSTASQLQSNFTTWHMIKLLLLWHTSCGYLSLSVTKIRPYLIIIRSSYLWTSASNSPEYQSQYSLNFLYSAWVLGRVSPLFQMIFVYLIHRKGAALDPNNCSSVIQWMQSESSLCIRGVSFVQSDYSCMWTKTFSSARESIAHSWYRQ